MLYELTKDEISEEIIRGLGQGNLPPGSTVYRANIGYYVHIPAISDYYIAEDEGLHQCAIYVNVSAEESEIYFGVCSSDDVEDRSYRYCLLQNTYTRRELINKILQLGPPAIRLGVMDEGVALFNVYRTTQDYPDAYDTVEEIIAKMLEEHIYPFGNNNLCPINPGSNLRLREFVYEEYDSEGRLLKSEPKFVKDKTHWLN